MSNMNRSDLQRLARLRIKEARVLLKNGHCEGAYYMAGYAIECALKACIAKKTKRHDFPEKKLVVESHTHNLANLVKLAGLQLDLDKEAASVKVFAANWAVVKDWSEDTRYRIGVGQTLARDLYSAIVSRRNGVFPWLKKRW